MRETGSGEERLRPETFAICKLNELRETEKRNVEGSVDGSIVREEVYSDVLRGTGFED